MGMSGEKSLPGTGNSPWHGSRGGSMRSVLQEQQGRGFAWRGVSKGRGQEVRSRRGCSGCILQGLLLTVETWLSF